MVLLSEILLSLLLLLLMLSLTFIDSEISLGNTSNLGTPSS